MQIDLSGWELSRQVQAASDVEGLLAHAGFAVLREILKLHGEGILAQRMYRKPDPDAASYADMVGHLRGLSEVESIARGTVHNGKQAAAEMRGAEERGK